jgi:hypothetical protein
VIGQAFTPGQEVSLVNLLLIQETLAWCPNILDLISQGYESNCHSVSAHYIEISNGHGDKNKIFVDPQITEIMMTLQINFKDWYA